MEEDIDQRQKNFQGDITSKVMIVLNGYCSVFNGKVSMTGSDSTILAESLVDFFEKLGEKGIIVSKTWQKT